MEPQKPTEAPAAPALRERDDIPDRFKWDLTKIFADWHEWQVAYDELARNIELFGGLQGSLALGGAALLRAMTLRDDIGRRMLDHPNGRLIGSAARNPMELMLAFGSLAASGVLERHPRLRCAFLEGTCGWLPWWLWRLDEAWEKFGPGSDVKVSARPSEYFFRQCYVATDADEKVLRQVVDYLAEVREGDTVAVYGRLVGFTPKRLHNKYWMYNETRASVAAASEVLVTCADLNARRTAPFPDDMAAGIRALWTRPYVDKARVGIYGTSYGGYSSALSILKHPDVWAAASASSAVTSWHHYDSIYTERYMWIPQENHDGYEGGNAMNFAKNLKGRLLIYYGTADNNVHPNNSMQLIKALQQAGKSFEVQVGPDAGHSGVNNQRMMEFFIENLIMHPERLVAPSGRP